MIFSSTDVAARQKRNEISMTRIALALLVSGLAINMAAASDLSQCLDPSTKLDAGGDVSDKELNAATNMCEAATIRLGRRNPPQGEPGSIRP